MLTNHREQLTAEPPPSPEARPRELAQQRLVQSSTGTSDCDRGERREPNGSLRGRETRTKLRFAVSCNVHSLVWQGDRCWEPAGREIGPSLRGRNQGLANAIRKLYGCVVLDDEIVRSEADGFDGLGLSRLPGQDKSVNEKTALGQFPKHPEPSPVAWRHPKIQ